MASRCPSRNGVVFDNSGAAEPGILGDALRSEAAGVRREEQVV
jgi:hypothetical protein